MPHSSWSAIGEGRYRGQFVGASEYGHVIIRISPSPPGSGLLFKNEITGGTIPKAFFPAVEEGVREAARRGIDEGFLVEDVEVDLVDGSYHDVDSSNKAFRIAAAMAFRDAIHKAGFISDTSGDDDASPVTEPRRPRPVPRDSAIALPEPDEALNKEGEPR
jgi:translation elongation factor EF-G